MAKTVTPESLAENCRIFAALMAALAGANQMPEGTLELHKYLEAVADVPQVASLLCDRLAPPSTVGASTWGRAG